MKKFGGTVKIKSGALRDVVLTKKVWERTQKLGILKQNVKKLWERRSHAFPPHYPPGRTRHLSQNEGPSLQFFSEKRPTNFACYSTAFDRLPRQADTVQCPVQAKQKCKI